MRRLNRASVQIAVACTARRQSRLAQPTDFSLDDDSSWSARTSTTWHRQQSGHIVAHSYERPSRCDCRSACRPAGEPVASMSPSVFHAARRKRRHRHRLVVARFRATRVVSLVDEAVRSQAAKLS